MASERPSWRRLLLFGGTMITAILTGFLAGGRHPDYVLFPALLMVIFSIWLFQNMRRAERDINYFFDAVESNDSSFVFPDNGLSSSTERIHRHLNRINQTLQNLKINAEIREHYYRAVIRQSTTGLVVISPGGEIEMINEAAAIFAGISPASTDTRLLSIRNPLFYEMLCRISPGENSTLQSPSPLSETLLLRARTIKAGERDLKLISLENIRRELDEKELESYQNLIRILTHEIMNSVAPLTSVSRTLRKMFTPDGQSVSPSAINGELIEATVRGLSTIDEQGKGLLNFVNNYRRLIRLPRPQIKPFDAREWAGQVNILVSGQLAEEAISFGINIEKDVTTLPGDKNLLNQVILNLVNNAVEALREKSDDRRIRISIHQRPLKSALVTVANNGPQIPQENLEKIFIPFFTTKQEGSGIGLALSRQILHMHKGMLSVTSSAEETVFRMEF